MEEKRDISIKRISFNKLIFTPTSSATGVQYKFDVSIYFSETDPHEGCITGLMIVRDPNTEKLIFEIEKNLLFIMEEENCNFSEENDREQELFQTLFTDISNEVYRLSKEVYEEPMMLNWFEYIKEVNNQD